MVTQNPVESITRPTVKVSLRTYCFLRNPDPRPRQASLAPDTHGGGLSLAEARHPKRVGHDCLCSRCGPQKDTAGSVQGACT